MTTAISITKLTPPQIAAVRQVFPGMVEAGIVTSTRSIVTFDIGTNESKHPDLIGFDFSVPEINKLLRGAQLASSDAKLSAALQKVRDKAVEDGENVRVTHTDD